MSNEKQPSSNPNKEKALARIAAVVGRYKIIKQSVLLNDVIKSVFGDQGDKEEEKANKRFKVISNLLNELVESGELNQFTFVKMTSMDGGPPSTINESIIVEGGFQLAGFIPLSSSLVDTDASDDSEEDDVFTPDEDELSDMIQSKASGYAVLNYTEGNAKREIYIKQTPQEVLGKYLSLVGDSNNSPDVFALIPVNVEIKSMLGKPVEVTETEGDEPEAANE